MKIYGIDFTSAPCNRKQIAYADCTLSNGCLHLNNLGELKNFDEFKSFLNTGNEWFAGIDFPFGLPKKLIEYLKWPTSSWKDYVEFVANMKKEDFEKGLKKYCDEHPKGRKHLLRVTDEKAKSRSPMMLYGVPVGKMFFEGAQRLLQSGASILPCYENGNRRIVVEAYPKLVANKLIYKPKYKSDNKKKQTCKLEYVRRKIVKKLKSDCIRICYGFNVELNEYFEAKIIDNPTGDYLDALLCAIQAGWAYGQRERGYGIQKGYEFEGWIVDPDQMIEQTHTKSEGRIKKEHE